MILKSSYLVSRFVSKMLNALMKKHEYGRERRLTLRALIFFMKTVEAKAFFQFENIINVLVSSF